MRLQLTMYNIFKSCHFDRHHYSIIKIQQIKMLINLSKDNRNIMLHVLRTSSRQDYSNFGQDQGSREIRGNASSQH